MQGSEEHQVYVQMVGDVILDTGCRTAVACNLAPEFPSLPTGCGFGLADGEP